MRARACETQRVHGRGYVCAYGVRVHVCLCVCLSVCVSVPYSLFFYKVRRPTYFYKHNVPLTRMMFHPSDQKQA